MFREALALRLSDVTRTLKQGLRAPHTAVPELVPAVCNLSSAERVHCHEGAMLQPAHALAFLPFIDPHTAQQLLITVHSVAEAAGSHEGPELELDADMLAEGDCGDTDCGLGPTSMLDGATAEEVRALSQRSKRNCYDCVAVCTSVLSSQACNLQMAMSYTAQARSQPVSLSACRKKHLCACRTGSIFSWRVQSAAKQGKKMARLRHGCASTCVSSSSS